MRRLSAPTRLFCGILLRAVLWGLVLVLVIANNLKKKKPPAP